MKRSPSKVKLRREAIRVLASLDLTQAVGGDAALLGETGAAMCTNQTAPKPPGG